MSNHFTMRAVDFFCGIGGMTNGFSRAGIKVKAGIDIDNGCRESYEINNGGAKFIHADIRRLSFEQLEKKIRIRISDDNMVFIGCSPCQYWTKIRTDRKRSASSKTLLADFQRFVAHYLPGFVVIENVPGIFTEEGETPLIQFIEFLARNNYRHQMGIIRACDYGVPQTRRRFLLLASRVSDRIRLPEPDEGPTPTVREFIGNSSVFARIGCGNHDTTPFLHSTFDLSRKNLERLIRTPKDGGTRLSYARNRRLAINSHYRNRESFRDTYARMHWDRPAPTITTKFMSISNGRFAHPEQDRGISLREGARLQTFSLEYFLPSNRGIGPVARWIGNAVPPELSLRIAKAILKSIEQVQDDDKA